MRGDKKAKIRLIDQAGWDKPDGAQYNSDSDHLGYPLIGPEDWLGYIENVTICGFEIDGNHDGNFNKDEDAHNQPGKFRAKGDGHYNMIFFNSCANVNVNNLWLHDGHGDGLRVNQCENIKFYNNKIYKLGHDGFYALRGTSDDKNSVLVFNNDIVPRTNSAIRLLDTSGKIYNNKIKGYINWDAGNPGIQIERNKKAKIDVEIYHNLIEFTYGCGTWCIANTSGLVADAGSKILIRNNIYGMCGTSDSILYTGGVIVYGMHGVEVINNTFDYNKNCCVGCMNASDTNSSVVTGVKVIVKNNVMMTTINRVASPDGTGYALHNRLTSSHTIESSYNCFYENPRGDYAGTITSKKGDFNKFPAHVDSIHNNYVFQSAGGRLNENDDWIVDTATSPCICAGDPAMPHDYEPETNDRISIGNYGNTSHASRKVVPPPSSGTFDPPVTEPTNPPAGGSTPDPEPEPDPDSDPEITPNFTANVTTGKAPLKVTFTDTTLIPSGTTITTWLWDVGNGNTASSARTCTYTYPSPGTYTVSLTLNSKWKSSKTGYIIVTAADSTPAPEPDPVVQDVKPNFTANITSGKAPIKITFTDTTPVPSGVTINSWLWNAGDGNTSSNPKTCSYTYKTPGTYSVSLTLNNKWKTTKDKFITITGGSTGGDTSGGSSGGDSGGSSGGGSDTSTEPTNPDVTPSTTTFVVTQDSGSKGKAGYYYVASGAKDSQVAINAAIKAAGAVATSSKPVTVYIKRGTYYINDPIWFTPNGNPGKSSDTRSSPAYPCNNVKLQGESGVIIKIAGGLNADNWGHHKDNGEDCISMIYIVGANNVTLSTFEVDGSYEDLYEGNGSWTYGQSHFNMVVVCTSNNIKADHLKMYRGAMDAFQLHHTNNTTISYCEINWCGHDAVQAYYGAGTKVHNCKIAMRGNCGIRFDGESNNCEAWNNEFWTGSGGGPAFELQSTASNILIHHNYFHNCSAGGKYGAIGYDGQSPTGSGHKYYNNLFVNCLNATTVNIPSTAQIYNNIAVGCNFASRGTLSNNCTGTNHTYEKHGTDKAGNTYWLVTAGPNYNTLKGQKIGIGA